MSYSLIVQDNKRHLNIGGSMKKTELFLLVFCLLIIFIYSSAVFPQNRRGITFDDMINTVRISDPQVSPDGKWISYTARKYNKEQNSSNSDIYLVSINGGEVRRLTSNPRSDSHARWSPDGSKIAFISTRSGIPQIWILPMTGGDAYQLTTISTGAGGCIWSPDGKKLAFVSEVYPDAGSDEENRQRDEAVTNSGTSGKMLTGLLYRHWNYWKNGKRNHVFVVDAEGGEAKDYTPGDYDTPPVDLGGIPDYAFSPDGTELCFVKNTDPVVAVSTNNDVYTVNLLNRNSACITMNPANDNYPVFTPDGKSILYKAQMKAGYEADRYQIMLLDRERNQIHSLTENLDRSVSEMIVDQDGSFIYFTAEDEGYNSIYKVSITGNDAVKVIDKSYNRNIQLTPDGKTFVFLRQRINYPAEIYKAGNDGSGITQLTDMNREILENVEMNSAENISWTGAGEAQVQGFLLKPPRFNPNRKYPMIVLIHGGPQNSWQDNFHYRWNAQLFASPGYIIFMPNPRGSTGYGQQFTDEISGDWSGKCYTDILNGVNYVLDNFDFIDRENVGAAGASFGGYMVNWIEGHNPGVFKCLFSHDGVFNLESMYLATEELWFPEWEMKGTPWSNPEMYRKHSPHNYIVNFKTPMLVVHGEKDYRVPIGEGIQLFTALQKMGVPSRFLYFPDEGHFVSRPQNSELWYNTFHDWFAEYLK